MNKFKLINFLFVLLVSILSCETSNNKSMNPTENKLQEVTYAIANLSFVPLRAEASHRSEMVTQALFGEYMKVLETKGGWCYVTLEQDKYKGWIELRQLVKIKKSDYQKFVTTEKTKVLTSFAKTTINGVEVLLPKGANLPFFKEGSFIFNNEKIVFKGEVVEGKQEIEKLLKTANSYLNTPYLWGGKTEFGLDCSGFSQIVYHINGYEINRDASQQAKQGELVAFLSEAKAGDLAFFDEEERITHVGIILDNEKIIHAAQGKVRIDSLDNEGIYNKDCKKYTHHLRMVRRYW